MVDVFAIATQRPVTCKPTETLGHAVNLMVERKFRRIPITMEEQLIGIITASDVLKLLDQEGIKTFNKKLGDVMTSNPFFVSQDTELGEATRIMAERGFGGLPIVSDEFGTLSGIITERDLVKEFAESLVDASLHEFIAEPITLPYSTVKIGNVVETLYKKNTSRIILTNKKSQIKGIISSTDILRLYSDKFLRGVEDDKSIRSIKASEIASTKVISVNENSSVKEIADLLMKHNLGGVPVVSDTGELMGMFTERDILRIVGTYMLF